MRLAIAFSCCAAVACGGMTGASPDAGGTPETPAFGCDTTNGSGLRTCTDYFAQSSDTAALTQQCTQSGGTTGTACDHANAVGGCVFTQTVGGVTVQTIYWYYYDTPSDIMAACAEAKAPFVSP